MEERPREENERLNRTEFLINLSINRKYMTELFRSSYWLKINFKF